MTSEAVSTHIPSEELKAQHIACTYLIRGCEDALGRVASEWLEAESWEEEAVNARAAEILDTVLDDWKETLEILRAVACGDPGMDCRDATGELCHSQLG